MNTSTPQTAPTFESVWAYLQESAQLQRESRADFDKRMKQQEKSHAETKRIINELGKKNAETERILNQHSSINTETKGILNDFKRRHRAYRRLPDREHGGSGFRPCCGNDRHRIIRQTHNGTVQSGQPDSTRGQYYYTCRRCNNRRRFFYSNIRAVFG